MKKEKVEDNLEVNQICNELHLNSNDKAYIHHKYGDQVFSKSEWVKLLKKDGLTIF